MLSSRSTRQTTESAMAAKLDSVTDLLIAWGRGDQTALDRLMPKVYEEARKIARFKLTAERKDHTLDSAALVNEIYLRLVDQDRAQWTNRAQFLSVAARMMRRVLVDHARRGRAAKRGGGERPVELDENKLGTVSPDHITDLHDALERLSRLDARQADIIDCRYFAGLSIEETASAVGVSPATVKREWAAARGWLHRDLRTPHQ